MLAEIKKLLKHSFIYGAANILQKGIGFLMIPVYTHYLTPADYGILELMDLTINIISMLTGMGLGAALIRYYHRYDTEQDKQEVFSTSLLFVFFLTGMVVLVLEFFTRPIAGLVLGEQDYYRYFQIMFVAMGLQTVAAVPESQLIAEAKSVQYSAISIITLVSYLSFNILFLVVFKWGLVGLLVSILVTKILNNCMLIAAVRKKLRFAFSWRKLKAMLSFSFPLIPASMAMFAIHFSDRFFVQRYCDLNDLGVYSLGYKFGMIISVLISGPFFTIWNTQRFEIINKQDNPGPTLSRFCTYFAATASWAGLGISVFIKEAVQIMAPAEYASASDFVALIALSYVFYGMASFFSLGSMTMYKTKYQAYIQVPVAALNIFLNILLIKRFGVMGAAYSTMLTFLALWIISMMNSQRLYPIPIEVRRLIKLAVVIGGLYAVSRFIEGPLFMTLAMKSLIMMTYPILLLMIGFFQPEELRKAKELLGMLKMRILNPKQSVGS